MEDTHDRRPNRRSFISRLFEMPKTRDLLLTYVNEEMQRVEMVLAPSIKTEGKFFQAQQGR